MKKKYGVDGGKRDYVINIINDHAVHIMDEILAVKVVRKNHPNQCTSGVIACTEQCIEGIQMNW